MLVNTTAAPRRHIFETCLGACKTLGSIKDQLTRIEEHLRGVQPVAALTNTAEPPPALLDLGEKNLVDADQIYERLSGIIDMLGA